MRFEIEGNPDYGEVVVELGPGVLERRRIRRSSLMQRRLGDWR